jgi:type II secretory pathway component GspD/PulD (secretin)
MTLRAASWVLVALSTAGGLPSAPAQQPGTTALSEKIQLARLLDLCAQRLGISIAYDASQLAGDVTLRTGREIGDEDLWALTNRVLAAHGHTTVQMAGEEVLTVVRIQEAASLARFEREDLAGARAGFVRMLRPLKFKSPSVVAPVVQRLLSGTWGKALDVGQGPNVLLADLKPAVEQALWVLDQLDREEAHVVEEILLQHRRAADLARDLEQVSQAWVIVHGAELRGRALATADSARLVLVAPEDEAPRWREWIAQFDRSEPVVTRTYVPRAFGVREVADLLEDLAGDPSGAGPFRQVVNELTGTLIVTASPGQHQEIEALLAQLEASGGSAMRSVRSYTIKNRDVSEILEVLEGMIEAGALKAGIVKPAQGARAEPGAAPAPEAAAPEKTALAAPSPTEQEPAPEQPPPVALASDEGTNTLIAVGELHLLQQIETLLQSLDVRQPQILVEALVLTMSELESLDLGVELRGRIEDDDTVAELASLFGLGTPSPSASSPPSPTGTGFTGVVLDPGDFSAVVRALETLNEGRSLTIPKVLVNNNEDATLDAVLQSPYLSTNASTTVATTSFGGTQDAGTQITVTPQITQGDHVLLTYKVTLSAFVGSSTDPTLPPPRQQNTLSSVVTLPDGYTIVLGGLEVVTTGDSMARLPLLGGLPLLGALFRNRATDHERQRFFVFLRATVLRRPEFEDLRYRSDRELLEQGLDPNWPEVEPRMVR